MCISKPGKDDGVKRILQKMDVGRKTYFLKNDMTGNFFNNFVVECIIFGGKLIFFFIIEGNEFFVAFYLRIDQFDVKYKQEKKSTYFPFFT